MTSGQLYIVHNCSNLNKISLSKAMICRIKQKVFSFFLKSLVSEISLMSTGRLFYALGAATENARSDETSLESGTTRSCLPAQRREARPVMLATGVTNSVRYGGGVTLLWWSYCFFIFFWGIYGFTELHVLKLEHVQLKSCWYDNNSCTYETLSGISCRLGYNFPQTRIFLWKFVGLIFSPSSEWTNTNTRVHDHYKMITTSAWSLHDQRSLHDHYMISDHYMITTGWSLQVHDHYKMITTSAWSLQDDHYKCMITTWSVITTWSLQECMITTRWSLQVHDHYMITSSVHDHAKSGIPETVQIMTTLYLSVFHNFMYWQNIEANCRFAFIISYDLHETGMFLFWRYNTSFVRAIYVAVNLIKYCTLYINSYHALRSF